MNNKIEQQPIEVEATPFDDELSDEALDRERSRYCVNATDHGWLRP